MIGSPGSCNWSHSHVYVIGYGVLKISEHREGKIVQWLRTLVALSKVIYLAHNNR